MKRGFTLIEMLIVVVIPATLMGMVFRLSSIGSDSDRRTKTIVRIQRLENCLSGYYAAFGSYPPVKRHGSPDPYLSVNSAWNLSPLVIHAEKIEEIYGVSDYITIHVPATAATKGMVGAEAISQMKAGAVVLNFARDTLVDETAMAAALEEGRIKRYVSDFPTPASTHMKNTIIIPHLGASTEEAEDNCAVMAVKQLQDYLDNGNIHNSVNYPEINLGVCETDARVGILHKNIPNMLSPITTFFGNQGLNIENLANKSRGNYAYTLLDLSHPMPHDTVERLKEIDGVIRVRRIVENK